MNVVVTGAAGFLGRRLVEAIDARGEVAGPRGERQTIGEIRTLDVSPLPGSSGERVRHFIGDVSDVDLIRKAIDHETRAVFHLAAIVSGEAESDFDRGIRVNLDGTRVILDTCRERGQVPRVVFASSVAVYGGTLPEVVTDATRHTPQSSYGTEKAIGELLVNDYTRRGFIDGRALRLPTISVRPGRPNAALSSFCSGVIREPLAGQVAICPVSPETVMWLLSPAMMIRAFLLAHDLDGARLGGDRTLLVPGLSVSVNEMVAALERAAGPEVATLVRFEPNEALQRIANTWPGHLDASRALALGFPVDDSFDAIVRQYIEETGSPR